MDDTRKEIEDLKRDLYDLKQSFGTDQKFIDTDIFGMFEAVNRTPSGLPKTVYDQIKIQGSTLWWFDYSTSNWSCTGFVGNVVSNAAGNPFPTGWSVSHPATGQYVITHNLGASSYAVIATPLATTTVPVTQTIGTNSFTIYFYNLSGVATDTNFSFQVA